MNNRLLLSLCITFTIIIGCQNRDRQLIIISKDSHSNIYQWLSTIDPTLKFVEFYYLPRDSMRFFLERSSGIIIGGGEDVNPQLYGKPDYQEVCEKPDNYRDSIETILIRYAFDNHIPLLGICRGQQILNAVNGGTLIPDIPTYVDSEIDHRTKMDTAHKVFIHSDSWLYEISEKDSIFVNSRHHQAVDRLADGFRIAAVAPDGIIESIEYNSSLTGVFIGGVQWHPETLENQLSDNIGVFFIECCLTK